MGSTQSVRDAVLHADTYKKTRSDKLTAKLQCLMQESAWSTASLTDCVENLSSYTLTTEEHQLLGLGLAFALPPRPETCADVITAIQHLESYARDIAPELRTLKGFVLTGLQHLNKAGAGLPRRLRVALQSLRTNSSVIILKA